MTFKREESKVSHQVQSIEIYRLGKSNQSLKQVSMLI